MPVSDGEANEQARVQFERRRRADRNQRVLLVDRLAQHHAPAPLALFKEVVEAAGADDVALDTINIAALGYRHLGLRHRSVFREVYRDAAEEM
jgi:hypothetical protein